MAEAKSVSCELNNDEIVVRPATREDMADVLRMIHELAEYEGVPDGPQLSVEDLVKDGFGASPPWFFCVVAEKRGGGGGGSSEGGLLGHALCNRAYSSWTRRALYVEDLFVRPHARRLGVASKLFTYLCQMAVREGVYRVDWHVLADNAAALGFYARLGARDLAASEGRAALRLDRPAVESVAAGGLLRPAPPAHPALPAHPSPPAPL